MRLFPNLLAGLLLVTFVVACHSDEQKLAATNQSPTQALPDSGALAQKATHSPIASADSGVHAVVTAYRHSIPPVDETKRDPALHAFVQKVISYAKKHQLQQLLNVADDSIAVSEGGGLYGKQEFRAYLNDPQNDGYAQICKALDLGCAIDSIDEGKLACYFPYLQAPRLLPKIEGKEYPDPMGTWVGIVPHIKLYEKPNKQSRLLASLSYPVLYFNQVEGEGITTKGWIKLETIDGQIHGYANDASFYELASTTVLIEKKRGTYKITSVAPFD